jgi:hypothetical protein
MEDRFGHGLGRIPSPRDERDDMFLARSVFPVAAPLRRRRKWYTENTRLWDQGNIGQCTAYSAAHLLAAGPLTQRPYTYKGDKPLIDTIAMYCRAQEIDKAQWGWGDPTFCQDRQRPGGQGDWGATMRGAAQVLRERGFIDRFWWLRTIDEVVAYLINVGPVWMGTRWSSDMSTPDGDGFIKPTGPNYGGHAYLVDQAELNREYVWILNSWGIGWGNRGRAKMRISDLQMLLHDRGEAIAVTEVRQNA